MSQEPTIHLTDHGLLRLRKRVGIPKKSALRHIARVLEKGQSLEDHADARYRRWVEEAKQMHPGDLYVQYGDFVYVFASQPDESLTLVTVLYPPLGGAWYN